MKPFDDVIASEALFGQHQNASPYGLGQSDDADRILYIELHGLSVSPRPHIAEEPGIVARPEAVTLPAGIRDRSSVIPEVAGEDTETDESHVDGHSMAFVELAMTDMQDRLNDLVNQTLLFAMTAKVPPRIDADARDLLLEPAIEVVSRVGVEYE